MEDQQPQPKSHKKRREKPILSCTFCRGRKLRCDRQSPCGACARRGQPDGCIFTCTEQERKDAVDYRPHNRNQKARQRITRLENLVTELRDSAGSASQSLALTTPSSNDFAHEESPLTNSSMTPKMGNLSLTDERAVYTGGSHWATILEDIQQLKDDLSDENPESIDETSPPFSSDFMHHLQIPRISLLSSITCLPRDQILAMLPPRRTVDRYISQYFNTFDSVFLHRGKFLTEYTNFWVNPSAVPIIWVGLLFSIMSMSVSIQQKELGAHDSPAAELQATLETFRTLTIHCLVAGDYLHASGSGYTVEVLILHFALDQYANIGTHMGNWVLMGVIVRVAMRMGLHRDPSHWPNIRPLQSELRRRAWAFLYSLDFFSSTQVGLPRLIKDSQCDTRPPSYVLDSDIGIEHDALPPERPFSEPSLLAFHIQRYGVVKVAAEIYDTTEAGPPSAAVIAALEVKLQKVVDALPAWLKPKPLEESVADMPSVIFNRMMLDIVVRKSIYLLNRHSFIGGSFGEDNTRSHEVCIEAALAILEYQRRMNEEAQPGGLMYAIRWRVSAPLNHEFLQATMMLCYSLSKYDTNRALSRRADILQALAMAKGIWEQSPDRSNETQRAVKAISVMLEQNRKNPVPIAVRSSALESSSFRLPDNVFDVFDNTFGQTMALDPSFFSVHEDMPALSSVIDELMTDTVTGLSGSFFEPMS